MEENWGITVSFSNPEEFDMMTAFMIIEHFIL